MKPTTHVLPPNAARLIEGLRDTGYDFNTALADVVDNSIDAKASVINVDLQMDLEGNITVTIADDGCGMDQVQLLNAMTYGAKSNKGPHSLGKFGLGLKTASTAYCRRLVVVTRDSGSARPVKAIWDLDHIAKVNQWELLLEDVTKEESEALDAAAKGKSGTLVVWDKVDRLLKAYDSPGGRPARNALKKIEDDFRQHAGMVYQRFLDPKDKRARNVRMILNGNPVEAWNPFCSDEPKTDIVGDESVPVEVREGEKAKFEIKAFVLPREEDFSSPAAHKKAKISNVMQGIYVYRENRLIHGPDWLGMFSKEPHGTFLRAEFSFDHKLDAAFDVDIKKSRVNLNEGLFQWLLNKFMPAPRRAADDRYRKGQRTKAEIAAKGAHAGSNVSIGAKEAELHIAEVSVTNKAKNEVEITNRKGVVRLKLTICQPLRPGEVSVQPTPSIDDGLLWEPCVIDSHHAVRINTAHQYYSKVYLPNLTSGVTVRGMDSLLWALSEAELGTVNEATKNHFQELRYEVSRILRKLVEDLPEPDLTGGQPTGQTNA